MRIRGLGVRVECNYIHRGVHGVRVRVRGLWCLGLGEGLGFV